MQERGHLQCAPRQLAIGKDATIKNDSNAVRHSGGHIEQRGIGHNAVVHDSGRADVLLVAAPHPWHKLLPMSRILSQPFQQVAVGGEHVVDHPFGEQLLHCVPRQ